MPSPRVNSSVAPSVEQVDCEAPVGTALPSYLRSGPWIEAAHPGNVSRARPAPAIALFLRKPRREVDSSVSPSTFLRAEEVYAQSSSDFAKGHLRTHRSLFEQG